MTVRPEVQTRKQQKTRCKTEMPLHRVFYLRRVTFTAQVKTSADGSCCCGVHGCADTSARHTACIQPLYGYPCRGGSVGSMWRICAARARGVFVVSHESGRQLPLRSTRLRGHLCKVRGLHTAALRGIPAGVVSVGSTRRICAARVRGGLLCRTKLVKFRYFCQPFRFLRLRSIPPRST